MFQYKQVLEGTVFIKDEWSKLRYSKIISGSLKIETIPHQDIEFKEGIDYLVDYETGKIRSLENSNLPDWSKHVFYQLDSFDQTKVENYGNQEYTVFISYDYIADQARYTDANGQEFEKKCAIVHNKLINKEEVTYLVFGDSISTGAESTLPENAYFSRIYKKLQDHYQNNNIKCINKAIGGETSSDGVLRINQDVVDLKPDLVSIAYGMNDQNKGEENTHFVEPETYYQNIKKMVTLIRDNTSADIILISPCLPNPKWKYSSGDVQLYRDMLHKISLEENVLFLDVTSLWTQEIEAGKQPESLLHNNINHPNDYGHGVYYRAFEECM